METLGFVVLATLALFSAAVVVFHRKPVVCALALAFNLVSIAGFYLLLDAQFLALLQVIVYAGAIMVLFLFVIMLLNLGHDYQADLRGLPALVVGSVVFGLTAWLISRAFTSPTTQVARGPGMLPADALAEHGAVGAVALPLFREYVVGFEVTSLLLLAAIIGAILLAKRRV